MSSSANAGHSAVMGRVRATQEQRHREREVGGAGAERDVEEREGERAEQERQAGLRHDRPHGGAERDQRQRPALRVGGQRAEDDGAGHAGQRRAAGALRELGAAAQRTHEAPRLPQPARLHPPLRRRSSKASLR